MVHTIYRRLLQAFLADERGNVFIMVAAASLMLMSVSGAAVDMSRAQMLQSRISSALDAAGLAAAVTANTTDVQTQAQKYFNANFPSGYMGSAPVTVAAALSTDKSVVTLTATTTQSTTFMRTMGINTVAVGASSKITRATSGMELALVLDVTGSMADAVNGGTVSGSNPAKITALQTAVTGTGGLLDILYGSSTTLPNLWIGVVPFSYVVNVGSAHTGWANKIDFGPAINSWATTCPDYVMSDNSIVTGTYTAANASYDARCRYNLSGSSTTDFGLTNWGGCVLARSTGTNSTIDSTLQLDESDDPPDTSNSATMFDTFYSSTSDNSANSSYACSSGSNYWKCKKSYTASGNNMTANVYTKLTNIPGPNDQCIAATVLPMTASKANVVTEVNGLTPNGSTMINLGLAWGYRMLSPNWVGLWGGEMNSANPQLPLPYHTALMNKVVVLMTDGQNSSGSPSAYNGQTTPSNSTLDTKTLDICTAMKSHGIIIYTIGFGTASTVDTTLLTNCASKAGYFFLAPTNADLATAFQTIGSALSNLRVSQ